ncbi:MAG: PAS domain-containing protein [Burkholderiaceae bacterium]|nr:PAS domain-containing protein [Burkholderiaceae bacterium]
MQLNHALQDAQEQLRLCTDLAQIAVWHHDLKTHRLKSNTTGWRLLGRTPHVDGLPLSEVLACLHPDDVAAFETAPDPAMVSGQMVASLGRFRLADGGWRHLRVFRIPQFDAAGEIISTVGLAIDVSSEIEGQQQNETLRRQMDLTTSLLGVGVWRLDLRTGARSWNAELRAMFELNDDAPLKASAGLSKVHPDDMVRLKAHYRALAEQPGTLREIEFRVCLSQGRIRHLQERARYEVSPEGELFIGLMIDVSERHAAQRALSSAKDRAMLAARGAGIGTWELDVRRALFYWDEQMFRLRGLSHDPQNLSGSHPTGLDEILRMVHPEDRARIEQHLQHKLFESDSKAYDFRVVLPDGRVRWLASRSSVVCDEQGQLMRRIGLNWDITESRLSDQLHEERELAQRASQAKSQFLARMSHELRTPLNAVLGFTQLLQADGGLDDTESVHRRLAHIRSAGEHLLSLINDVLDLSRLEAGDMRVDLKPVELQALVASSLPLVDRLATEHDVNVRTGELKGVVLADPTRLRQVLLNLLSNAIKYNRPRGEVVVESRVRKGQVHLRVSDSGRGLSVEQRRHLFEPFNRLGRENESIEGTGIGLAIVKALVERMNGTIDVESQPGLGSCFEIRLASAALDAVPSAQPPLASQAAGDAPVSKRGRLLYIEDNPVNVLVVQELVARRAHLRLHCEETGRAGLSRARKLLPDLILLDMQLPDFDGFEVLRRLRADPQTRHIPCIALSANAMGEDIERALQAGFADYWTKPIDFKAFLHGLDTLFSPASSAKR